MNPEELFGTKILYRRLMGLSIFSLLVLLLPIVIRDIYHLELLFLCHYYVILACSWDLLTGFTGNVNFGHAFFIGSRRLLFPDQSAEVACLIHPPPRTCDCAASSL